MIFTAAAIFWTMIGINIGSFLNVCIYRIPAGESIVQPPSHCPKCGRMLGWSELIPVLSYIFLRGRCKGCGDRISPRYALVELLTGALFLAAVLKFGITPEAALYSAFAAVLLVVAFIDHDHKIIHDGTVLAAGIIAVALFVLNIYKPLTAIYGAGVTWWEPLLGLLPGAGVLWLVAMIGKLVYTMQAKRQQHKDGSDEEEADEGVEAMGMGDVLIAIPIGIALGWKLTILAIYSAIIAGGAWGTLLIFARKKDRKDAIPFGPFIVAGTFLAIFWGNDILNLFI